jgi:hypothetical protein
MQFAQPEEKGMEVDDNTCEICGEGGNALWRVSCCKKVIHYACVAKDWRFNRANVNKCAFCRQYPGDITAVSPSESAKLQQWQDSIKNVMDVLKSEIPITLTSDVTSFGEKRKQAKSVVKQSQLEKDQQSFHNCRRLIEQALNKMSDLADSIAEKNYQCRMSWCQF